MSGNGVMVAQLGARMHFAVPRILHEAEKLDMLHTDICAVKGWPVLARKMVPRRLRPRGLQRLLGRVPIGVPEEKIKAYTSFGWEYAQRKQAARDPAEMINVHLWAGKTFNQLIIKHGMGDAAGVYTFNSAGLELLQEARRRGLHTVIEQTIAPQVIERDLLDYEFEQFPELQGLKVPKDSWQLFADREACEWDSAHRILCGSQFVVECIRKAGGPAEKTVVVPYGIDVVNPTIPVGPARKKSAFNVLFVGQVGIRKGAHYLFEAARLLEKDYSRISFRLVGVNTLPANVLKTIPTNITLTGPVPRTKVHEQFAWADIFCLPSLCEGSATVTYEALAMGLPVICTPNTGSVVTDGVDGYVIPIRDAASIAGKIVKLASDSELVRSMSIKAQCKAADYTISKYSSRLLDAITEGI